MKRNSKKKALRVLSATLLMATMLTSTAFAGQWKQEGSTWKYANDSGANVTGWNWIDGKCYFFEGNGNMLANTTTPDGYTVNADGAWVVNGAIQTQDTTTSTSVDTELPLKGRIEQYFAMDPTEGLIWAYDEIYLTINRKDLLNGEVAYNYIIRKAIEDRNIFYMHTPGKGVVATLAKLAGVPISAEYESNPKTHALANEIKAFLNSFDWKNASDMEKAVNICNWIQKADYDYDNLSNVDAESHNLYGCLVEKKALCDGYTEAARVLGLCVGLPVDQIGSANHGYPVFFVDGVWLANEPTTKNKFFTIANTFTKTYSGEYQLLGKYCEGTGYVMPADTSQIINFN